MLVCLKIFLAFLQARRVGVVFLVINVNLPGRNEGSGSGELAH
jgi:hypothetical protein